jgi:hypothetical protein
MRPFLDIVNPDSVLAKQFCLLVNNSVAVTRPVWGGGGLLRCEGVKKRPIILCQTYELFTI